MNLRFAPLSLEAWNAAGFEYETSKAKKSTHVPLTTPDYAKALVVPANICAIKNKKKQTRSLRDPKKITHVVIHTLIASYAQVIKTWSTTGGRCHMTHYVVRNDGEVTQLVGERYMTIHGNGANKYSIGIEHDGDVCDPCFMTDAMYVGSAALVRDICDRYNIPKDGAHIIGHDQAPGTEHGDPGGYWDWAYYLALVKWDGVTASKKPVRLIAEATTAKVSSNWTLAYRVPRKRKYSKKHPGCPYVAPTPDQSWGKTNYVADPSRTAHDPAEYWISIPAPGTYDVSLWWPALQGNNPTVTVEIENLRTGKHTTTIRQNAWGVRSRKTVALPATPTWFSVKSLDCNLGDIVVVRISRRSDNKGVIVADAVRLLRV